MIFWTKSNIGEFVELIVRYDAITLDDVADAWERASKECPDGYTVAQYAKELLTGFGSIDTCLLCKSAVALVRKSNERACDNCAWRQTTDSLCYQDGNYASFISMRNATTPYRFYRSIKNRAKRMKKVLEQFHSKMLIDSLSMKMDDSVRFKKSHIVIYGEEQCST